MLFHKPDPMPIFSFLSESSVNKSQVSGVLYCHIFQLYSSFFRATQTECKQFLADLEKNSLEREEQTTFPRSPCSIHLAAVT